MTKKRNSIQISNELHNRIKELSDNLGISIISVVSHALLDYLAKFEERKEI